MAEVTSNPIDKDFIQQKREELMRSLRDGKVKDPVSILISIGIAVAVSVGTTLVARALAGKPPIGQTGVMNGTVQLQTSQQGTFIPEIYGAAPTITTTAGEATPWSFVVNGSTSAPGRLVKNAGADQTWNCGAAYSTAVTADEDAFIEGEFDDSSSTFNASAIGFSTSTNPSSGQGVGGVPNMEFGVIGGINHAGTDQFNNAILERGFRVIINGIGSTGSGHWYPGGGKFRVEKRGGTYRLYYGYAEIASFTPPTPSATLYLTASCWRTGFGLLNSYVKINDIGTAPSAGSGGCKVPASIVWGKNPEKHSYITTQTTRGSSLGGGSSTQTENVYYTIDLRANYARGSGDGLDLLREYANSDIIYHNDPNLVAPTGVHDPTGGTTGVYLPTTPPNPLTTPVHNQITPILRSDGDLIMDSEDVGTGTVQLGASGIGVYPGNMTQDIDPTEEADVDTRFGVGSTTAHRGKAGVVHADLNLQRWQNIPPNFTAVWQHKNLKTLDAIYASMAQRPVDQNGNTLLSGAAYDFSGVSSIWCRGMLIDGRPFSPSEIIDNPEIQDAYNYFSTEGDGQMLLFVNGSEPSITIPESDFGWVGGDSKVGESASGDADLFTPIRVTKLDETQMPRKVSLGFINPGEDWEPDLQSVQRKVTLGNKHETLHVQLTMNPDEGRSAAGRRLYKIHVGEPVNFTLHWKYKWLYPGYRIVVNSSAGITYTIRLTSMPGGIGILDCEGVLLEVSSFNQNMVGSTTTVYNPAHPIPATTLLSAMDIPAYRPEDRDKFGLYVGGAPIATGEQVWGGWALQVRRNNKYIKEEEFAAPAILGRIATVTGTPSTNPNATDNTTVVTVDLYGTEATLESVTEAEMIAGVNRICLGDTIAGYATATRVAGYPNRWNLTVFRFGQFDTFESNSSVTTGRNFALLNSAVKFVELDPITDLNVPLFVKAVSLGQSISDVAELEIVATGNSAKARPPTTLSGTFDPTNGGLLLDWILGLEASTEGAEHYELELRSAAGVGASTIRGPIPISPLQLARNTIHPPLEEHTGASVMFGCWKSTVHTTFWQDPAGAIIDFPTYCLENGGFELRSKNDIDPAGGFMIETEIGDNYLPLRIGIAEWNGYFVIGPTSPVFWWESVGNIINDPPSEMTVVAKDNDGVLTHSPIRAIKGERLSIVASPDGTVSFYLNFLGASSQPVAIANRKIIDFSKKYRLFFSECSRSPQPAFPGSFRRFEFRKTRFLRQTPEFVYTGDMQRYDNSGSLPATVYARLRQKSLYPFGTPSSWVYGTFVR